MYNYNIILILQARATLILHDSDEYKCLTRATPIEINKPVEKKKNSPVPIVPEICEPGRRNFSSTSSRDPAQMVFGRDWAF